MINWSLETGFQPRSRTRPGGWITDFFVTNLGSFFDFTRSLSVVPSCSPRKLSNIYTKGMERCICSRRSVLSQGFSWSLACGGCRLGQLRGAFLSITLRSIASWFLQHVPEGYGMFEQFREIDMTSVYIECAQSHDTFVSMYVYVPNPTKNTITITT